MEAIGAIIFFGGLTTALIGAIYFGTKKGKPDLIVPLPDGELHAFVDHSWTYLVQWTEGERRGAWEVDPLDESEILPTLRELGLAEEEAGTLIDEIRKVEPRTKMVSGWTALLAIAATVSMLLAWGAGMAEATFLGWALLALGLGFLVLAGALHYRRSSR